MRLVINPEQHADGQKRQHDRDIGQARQNERAPAPPNIRRGQHALHHVLIGAVRGHGDEGRSDQAGENCVLDLEHSFDFVPAMFGRIESGGEEIRDPEAAVALDDFVPATGNLRIKQTDRDRARCRS